MQKLTETGIPQNYSSGLYNTYSYDLIPEMCPKVGDVIFEAVSACLGDMKNKNNAVAFIFNDFNKDFLVGAVIEYEPNEDPKQPGSWNYFWTWNEDDIPEGATKTDLNQALNASYFKGVSQSKYAFGFNNLEALTTLTVYFFKTIYNWLNDNASDKAEEGIELDGVFHARVVVENDEKIMSIEPDGEMKKLIKDDLALEVA